MSPQCLTPEDVSRLDALFARYARSDQPGCVVAIARDGRPVYRRALGMADLSALTANQPSTPMPVGSIAKQFTCALLLQLQARGVLSLEDPLGRWLPELAVGQSAPTLSQIMRHQGGVRCYLDQWMFNGYRTLPEGLPWTIQQRQQSLDFVPGSHSAYSNGGYLLLSKVVERAAGTTFSRVVARELLGPVGMYASEFPVDRTAATSDLATAYLPTAHEDRWRPARIMSVEAFGDGGMVSTADDLIRWASFLRRDEGPVCLRELFAPEEPSNPGPADYRFGLIRQVWRGLTLAHHGGGLPGANSALIIVADAPLDVVVLFNRTAPATTLALQALEILLGATPEPPVPPPTARDHHDILGSYYAPDAGLLFALHDVGGDLALGFFGDSPFPVESCSAQDPELPFWADVGAAQLRFRRGTEPGAVDVFDGRDWSTANRVGDLIAAQAATDFIDLCFYSAEAAATLSLVTHGDALRLAVESARGADVYEANPAGPDLIRFRPSAYPASKLARLVRDADGLPSAIVVSTSRTRGLRFDRLGAPLEERQS